MNIVIHTADKKSLIAKESITTTISPASRQHLTRDIKLYVLPDRLHIMGHEIILGLDTLHSFNVKIESSTNGMVASIDGQFIATEIKSTDVNSLMVMQFDSNQIDPFESLINEFEDVFAESAKTLIKTEPMKIPLISSQAVKARLRPHSRDDILEIDRQVQSMIANDIIEPSESRYAANVHLVPKKSGSKRMVVDFRQLNLVTEKDSFPLPQIADLFLALHGATCFAALDCTEGFLQIPILPEHRHRTAFVTAHGAYHFKRCPFGFTNSPAVFQRTMNRIFDRGLYKKCVIYIDDILVYAKCEQDLLDNLRWVFQCCRDNVVKLKRSKCKINVKECEFLGFRISHNQIAPVIGKYDPIGSIVPRNQKDVRGILGALNHYARFIDKYTDKTAPIRQLTRKDVVFEWTSDLTNLVNELKQELNSALPQYIPHSDTDKIIDIYISQISLEVTCYEHNQKFIGRAGCALSEAEANYTTIEQNILAIILAYSKFGPILRRQVVFRTACPTLRHAIETKHRSERVERLMLSLPPDVQFSIEVIPNRNAIQDTIATSIDHEELFYTDGACVRNGKADSKASWAVLATMNPSLSASGIVEHRKVTNQIAEISAILEACRIAIENKLENIIIVTDSKYAEGAINKWIDCWKRNEWKDCRGKTIVNEELMKKLANYMDQLRIKCLYVKGHSGDYFNEKVDIMAKQVLETTLNLAVLSLDEPLVRQEDDEEIETIKNNLAIDESLQNKYVIDNDELYFLDPHLPATCRKRLFVPQRDRKLLLKVSHDHCLYGGHLGVKKTKSRLQAYYWPKMTKEIERYIETCEVCQKHKTPKRPRYGLMQPIKVSEIFERIHVDIVGPMRQTNQASRYIITAIDAFSRYAYARATVEARTRDVINFLKEEIFVKHGPPNKLVSDNGVQFTSNDFQSFINSLGIRHSKTCEYHPQSNGLDERLNGTLVKIFKNYINQEQTDWDKHLAAALFVYNTTRHESIDTSPYVAVYGVLPRSPLKYLEHELIEQESISNEDRHKIIRDFIKQAQEAAQLDQKKYYDAKRQPHNFQVLDLVKAKFHHYTPGLSRKLLPKWESPCIITQIIESDRNPVAAKLRNLETGKTRRSAFVDLMPLEVREEFTLNDSLSTIHGDVIAAELSREPRHYESSYDELLDISRAPMPVPFINTQAPSVPCNSNTPASSYDEIAIPNSGLGNQNVRALSSDQNINQFAPARGAQPETVDALIAPAHGSQPETAVASFAPASGSQPNAVDALSAPLRGSQSQVDASQTFDPVTAAPVRTDQTSSISNTNRDDNHNFRVENVGGHASAPQHHSTPIANIIPNPLDAGTTSIIASDAINRQVNVTSTQDTIDAPERAQTDSHGRPKRTLKKTDRYQA